MSRQQYIRQRITASSVVWTQIRRIVCDGCSRPFSYLATGDRTVEWITVPEDADDRQRREAIAAECRSELAELARSAEQGEAICPHCRRYQRWMVSTARTRNCTWALGVGAMAGGVVAMMSLFFIHNDLVVQGIGGPSREGALVISLPYHDEAAGQFRELKLVRDADRPKVGGGGRASSTAARGRESELPTGSALVAAEAQRNAMSFYSGTPRIVMIYILAGACLPSYLPIERANEGVVKEASWRAIILLLSGGLALLAWSRTTTNPCFLGLSRMGWVITVAVTATIGAVGSYWLMTH